MRLAGWALSTLLAGCLPGLPERPATAAARDRDATVDARALDARPRDARPFDAFTRPDGVTDDAAWTLSAPTVRDAFGTAWTLEDAPRRPHIEVRIAGGDATELLTLGAVPPALTDLLRDDCATPPLRASTIAALVPATVECGEEQCTWVARDRWAPGATLSFFSMLSPSARLDDGARCRISTLRISSAARAGAALRWTWPPSGVGGLPSTLDTLRLDFDGALDEVRGWAVTVDDREVTSSAARVVCPTSRGGDCVEVRWDGAGEHVVVEDRMLVDATGEVVSVRAELTRDGEAAAPRLLPIDCALDALHLDASSVTTLERDEALCVMRDGESLELTLSLERPTRMTVETSHGRTFDERLEGTVFLRMPLGTLDASTVRLQLVAIGGTARSIDLALDALEPAPSLTVSEVRANPYGTEPDQEFVELWNIGHEAVELVGLHLADGPTVEGIVLPSTRPLAPDARILLVASSFDRADPRDVTPLPGARLLMVGRAVVPAGIANAGEPIFLREGSRRIAEAPAIAVPEGRCLVRTDRGRGPEGFVVGDCSPGR